MDFKSSLPSALYEQATSAKSYRFCTPITVGSGQVCIDSRWSLSLDPSCGGLAKVAADDLRLVMTETFGQSLCSKENATGSSIHVSACNTQLSKPESYHIHIASDAIKIDAFDDEGAMRALFHLRWKMLANRSPVLNIGQETKSPNWELRIASPVVHQPRDTPRDYLDLPESYLLNMARYGYNATYIYVDWFDYMSPQVVGALARPGWHDRLDDLRHAAEYLARFGIRLLFHVNTIALPGDHPLFTEHPDMRGAQTFFPNQYCLCSSDPAVKALCRRAAEELFAEVPSLAGAVLIVGGECFLHCYTRPNPKTDGKTNCPRCSKSRPEDVISQVVNAFSEGARSSNPNAHVLMWPYSAFSWGDLDSQKRLIHKLDPAVTNLITFEKDSPIKVGESESYVFDYSISHIGPSSRFELLLKESKCCQSKVYARTETTTGIEMFNVPYIPVMQRWAQRYDAIRTSHVDGVHTSWRFYGFCAQRNDEIVDYYNWEAEPDRDQFLNQIAARDFGPEASDKVAKAWKHFSTAFGLFPYSAGLTGFPYFRGPFYLGPAHPFVFDLTAPLGLSERFWSVDRTVEEAISDENIIKNTRSPRFFLDATWTQPFGLDLIISRFAEIDDLWQQGLQQLTLTLDMPGKAFEITERQGEYNVAFLIGSMFRTAFNLARFQKLRDQFVNKPCGREQVVVVCQNAIDLLKLECTNAEAAYAIVQKDNRLGYVATYGQAFDALLIEEKIQHTKRQIEEKIPNYLKSYLFHFYGLSTT